MHLTRPKSSKGRSRPTVHQTVHGEDTASTQSPPVTPKPPAYNRPDGFLRSQSQTLVRQSSQLSQDQVVHMQFAPVVPTSLNKYKVLPSIERRQSEVNPVSGIEKMTSKLNLSHNVILQERRGHGQPHLSAVMTRAVTCCSSTEVGSVGDAHQGVWPKPPDPGPTVTEVAKGDASLLLAIRAPCGSRFQQHFRPTDTLLAVRASAEARYGTSYGEAFVETMDVPRRTFTDMDMTLAQCGIVNKSVLCISQEDSSVEYA
ncbi:UBX domain-containing protein 10 [Diretmus argenteus]